MKAEIITIGDEILIGQIVDTNSSFIAKALNKIGISVSQITSVQDEKVHILQALKNAKANSDLVLLTGGLGPTKDDITKTTFVEFFEDQLVPDPAVLAHIKDIWKKYIKQPLLQVNLDQALVPSKATVLMNASGTAPGLWMEKESSVFIALPGVPFEMKALLQNEVLPRLSKTYELPFILHKTLLTYGLGESIIADRISNWESKLPKSIKLAYLPNLGRVRLRLSSKGFDKALIESTMAKEIQTLIPLIADVFVGFEEDTSIEQIIGTKLLETGKTLALAESCTGGKIAAQFTAHSGASGFFKGGVVAYDTNVKITVLGVQKQLITQHSVVSTEVAKAMALGVQKLLDSDYAIATTGNAGPAKGDSNADLGTVCIAIATPNQVYAQSFSFGKERHRVLIKSLNMALTLLQKEIFKN